MSRLHAALANPFSYTVDGPLSLWERVKYVRDQKFLRRNIEAIAARALQRLNELPRLRPKEAVNHPERASFRQFLRIAEKVCAKSSVIQRCKDAFLAFQLGIPAAALEETVNPGFASFAKRIHLQYPLSTLDHVLEVAEGSSALSILHGGVLQPWEAVRRVIETPSPRRGSLPHLYSPPFQYGLSGVQNTDYYAWQTLEPFKREENHSWGDRYVLEVCCLASQKFRAFGDHTWIRLKTPNGEVISFGVYREDNFVPTGWCTKKARIQSPDVSEFWPEKIHAVGFEISREGFQRVKENVERIHRENNLEFHVVHKNCTTQTLAFAKLAGIHISMETSFVYNFIPRRMQKFFQKFTQRFPRPFQWPIHKTWALIHYVFSVFCNISFALLGGTKLSPSLSEEERRGLKPYIASFWDLFKASKVKSQSPGMVAFELIDEVKEARRIEAERRGVSPEELRYWVPDTYRRGG